MARGGEEPNNEKKEEQERNVNNKEKEDNEEEEEEKSRCNKRQQKVATREQGFSIPKNKFFLQEQKTRIFKNKEGKIVIERGENFRGQIEMSQYGIKGRIKAMRNIFKKTNKYGDIDDDKGVEAGQGKK